MKRYCPRPDFLRRFQQDENASGTMEAVLWTPIFLILFGMVTDTSVVFGRQAEILRIIQDSNRFLAVGFFETTQEAEDYITERVVNFSPNTTVAVSLDDQVVSTLVTLPAADLTSTGLFDAINTLTITLAASQMSEVEP